MPLADNLRTLRENRRLFQKDAAEGVGIPLGTYVSYERAEVDVPPAMSLYAMAKFFEVTMEELLDLEPLSATAVRAQLAENKRLRERLARYEAFDVAMPYIERAHRDMGRLLAVIEEHNAEPEPEPEANGLGPTPSPEVTSG